MTLQTIRYYTDENPGFRRERRGRGFSYFAPDGTRVVCRDKRDELASVAVPPAYDDVWLSPYADGHLVASGRDDKARKQYLYHPLWTEYHEALKFDRLKDVGAKLPRLRRWISRHLKEPVGHRETAIAAALALMDRMSLRVGDPAYTEANGSHGAITLRADHLHKDSQSMRLEYQAKGGAGVRKRVVGSRLKSVLAEMAQSPDAPLLSWRDVRGWRGITGTEVNDVFSQICGIDASVKDIRTWNGTHAAFLAALAKPDPTITALATAAAHRLHNTPSIARTSYIHPAVLEERSRLAKRMRQKRPADGFRRGEPELLHFLERRPMEGTKIRLIH